MRSARRALLSLALGTSLVSPITAQVGDSGSAASPEALTYLNAAIDSMQLRSLRRDSIDWASLRERALSRLGPAQTSTDTYETLSIAVRELGDRHSGFFPPRGVQSIREGPQGGNSPAFIQGEGRVGYMMIVRYFGGTREEADDFVRRAHSAIAEIDGSVCGWVVDLRENGGGNMWPMLAAVGPILGEGEVGSFVDADGALEVWTYLDGGAHLRSSTLAAARGATYRPLVRKPVAILTSPRTASSGEAVAVAFRGRPDTRSFGLPTAGLSTGNQGFFLGDGAMLNLTTVVFADRNGTRYGGRIQPDELIPEPNLRAAFAGSDRIVDSAKGWLLEHEQCRGAAGN